MISLTPMTLALIGGLILAVISGSLGCFVVWRRMAYFGDAIAHSALTGVAIGLWWGLDMRVAVVMVALLFALLLALLVRERRFSTDTLLGILAHGGLATGIVFISLGEKLSAPPHGHSDKTENHDLLHGVLFGDITHLNQHDIWSMALVALVILTLLVIFWRKLLMVTIQEDIAQVEGINTKHMHVLLMTMLAITIAMAVKMVGALLIASLLILPAAAARYLSASPAAMAVNSVLLGMIAVSLGVMSANSWHLPVAATIVLAATLIFTLLFVTNSLQKSAKE